MIIKTRQDAMRYTTDKKSGLDPLFGLPVTRESKAMDAARNRNFRSDKRLEDSLKSIDQSKHSKIVKCNTKVTKTREFLDAIKSEPEKMVVCPTGLSFEQKQTIRMLRRGSLPSMSLREFDERLITAKINRGVPVSAPKERECNRNELSEFRLKRTLFSGNSKKYQFSQSTPNMDLCLVENVTSTRNPLYRCKSVIGGAYKRLTSADVSIGISHLKDQPGKTVTAMSRFSPSDLSNPEQNKNIMRQHSNGSAKTDKSSSTRRSGTCETGTRSLRVKNAISPRTTGNQRLLRRRMTMPDLQGLQDGLSTTSSSGESSGLVEEEERYERFLTVLKGEAAKLPKIQ